MGKLDFEYEICNRSNLQLTKHDLLKIKYHLNSLDDMWSYRYAVYVKKISEYYGNNAIYSITCIEKENIPEPPKSVITRSKEIKNRIQEIFKTKNHYQTCEYLQGGKRGCDCGVFTSYMINQLTTDINTYHKLLLESEEHNYNLSQELEELLYG